MISPADQDRAFLPQPEARGHGSIHSGEHCKCSSPTLLRCLLTSVQYTIPDGDDKGLQVIVMKPAKAFEFLKLPAEARKIIYDLYFNAKGIAGEPIVLDGKRKTESKDPYAKSYASGSKCRVALLAVCKEVSALSYFCHYSWLIQARSMPRPLRSSMPIPCASTLLLPS